MRNHARFRYQLPGATCPLSDLALLVSRDKDLLDLMKDDVFRKAYPNLAIVDPLSFLADVRVELANDPGTA